MMVSVITVLRSFVGEFQRLRVATGSDRGATAIMVAICMVVLMGFAALAMDGGLGFDDRRGTQNAADNAALAAAWEACNPANSPADPVGAALAVAAENGYDASSPDTSVAVTELSPTEYEVSIETSNDTTFAAAGVGSDTVSVTSRAIGSCEEEPFLGGYAIFAGAENCPSGGALELSLTGATKTINGGIFSNGDLTIQGANTTVNGPVEYRDNYSSNSGVPGEQYFGSPKPYPLDLEITDFQGSGIYTSDPNFHDAAGAQIDNDWMVTNGFATGNNPSNSKITITSPGIYYTGFSGGQDAIDLSSVSVQDIDGTPGPDFGVTFVSVGTMHIVGEADMMGYAPVVTGGYSPILFFSNATSPASCNHAIQFSGNNITWEGLMFAPNGEVKMSSSANTSVHGSIIAYTVDVSGSDFSITWQDDPNADPRFIVELQQ